MWIRARPSSPATSSGVSCRCSSPPWPSASSCKWLGLYVASFLLITGFMRFIGRIAWWKCLVTSIVFVVTMFLVFDVAFDVIMPKGPVESWLGK